MGKYWKYIPYLIIAFLGIAFFVYQSSTAKSCDEAYLELKSMSFQGTIKNKIIDSSNHMNKLLIIVDHTNLDTIWMTADKSGLFEYSVENDSLSKVQNSYIVRSFREKEIKEFIIDYECD